MRWGHSGVASRPTRSGRSARLYVVRLQSAGAGLGLEIKRSALDARLSVHKYSKTEQQQSVSVLGSDALLCQNTKHYDNLSALGTSIRRQNRSSDRELGRLGPTPIAAYSAGLFAAPDHNCWSTYVRISWRTLTQLQINQKFLRIHLRRYRFKLRTTRPFSGEYPTWSNSETKIWTV